MAGDMGTPRSEPLGGEKTTSAKGNSSHQYIPVPYQASEVVPTPQNLGAGLGVGYRGLGLPLLLEGAARVVEHCAEPG